MPAKIFSFFFLIAIHGFAETLPSNDTLRVRHFLNRIETIRVAATACDGNGHQALAITLIKNLRAIGYYGKIELSYDIRVKKRFEYLLPPFRSDGPDKQYISGLDVTAISYNEEILTEQNFSSLPLTIVAGPNQNIQQPSFFNSDHVLYFTPPHWANSPFLIGHRWTVLKKVRDSFPLHFDNLSVTEVGDFLANQLSHSSILSQKLNGLKVVIESARANHFALLSAYGVGYDGVDRLVTLVKSLLRAQALDLQFPQSIVIGLISNLNEKEWNTLTQRLYPSLWRALSIESFKESTPGVSILKIGNVPPEVWNLLMRESTLPPLAAGANGVDFLFQQSRPFVITTRKYVGGVFKFESGLVHPDDTRFARDFLKKDLKLIQRALDTGDIETLARFYMASTDPQSETNQRFARFSKIVARLPDRVCSTLLEVEQNLAKKTFTPLSSFIDWLDIVTKFVEF